MSPMLLIGIIAAVISSAAVVISAIVAAQPGGPPPDGGGGPPGPPPGSTIPLIISSAFFVVSWATVAVAVARDELAHRMNELHVWMEQMLHDYGEQRETEGYLKALRAAAGPPGNGDVRPLRKVPPPEK
jgi:hypothetical protein